MSGEHLLNPQQFFHTSNTEFAPGHELTREGAWRARQKSYGLDDATIDRAAANHRRFHFEEPRESHLYYGDRSFLPEAGTGMYGQHTYEVQPVTSRGAKINKHSLDPHYKETDRTAYRTTGRLKVVRKLSEEELIEHQRY